MRLRLLLLTILQPGCTPQRTCLIPLKVNSILMLTKSHQIGPAAVNHRIPRTMSQLSNGRVRNSAQKSYPWRRQVNLLHLNSEISSNQQPINLAICGYFRDQDWNAPVQHYGMIARPLTLLLKKDAFVWSEEATIAFDKLKSALCNAPVLALPDFSKDFVVEADACGYGVGWPSSSLFSRQLKGRQLNLSIYEKELLAVVFVVQKWRNYLLTGHFIIKIDQRSLKYLLEQRLNTPVQQQWLPKLLEFDYEIQYKEGKENLVADALSRLEDSEALTMAITVVQSKLLQEIQTCYTIDPQLKEIIELLKGNPLAKKHYTWFRDQLRRRGKLVIGNNVELRNKLLEWLHCSRMGGHSGQDATIHKVKGLFYGKGMSKDIQRFIRSCTICQRNKYDTSPFPDLLQPLPFARSLFFSFQSSTRWETRKAAAVLLGNHLLSPSTIDFDLQSPKSHSHLDPQSSASHNRSNTPHTPSNILPTPLHNQPPDPSDPISTVHPLLDARRAPFNSNAPFSTRLTKVDIPNFDGTFIKEWIYCCEQFFMIDNTTPELKVRLASIHLEGKALQWHHNYIQTWFEQFPSWPKYIIDISARFGRLYDDPLGDLVNLKQGTDSVVDFLDKFKCTLTRLHLPVPHALSLFVANLNPNLQPHVRQFKPDSLAEAARLAKLHESSLALTPQMPSKSQNSSTPFQKPFSPKTFNHKTSPLLIPDTAKPFSQRIVFSSLKLLTNKPAKKLSYEEMQESKSKGLCMFCEEPYTPGHQLKHKRSQIYMLECDEVEPSDEIVDALIPEDLQVAEVEHTHYFVNLDTAKVVGCRMSSVKPLVVAAVGHKLISDFVCENFSWKHQGYEFCTENFMNMRIEFMVKGVKHVLRGTNLRCKVVKGSSLNKILLYDPQVALLQLCDPNTLSASSSNLQLCHINASGTESTNDLAIQEILSIFSNGVWESNPVLQQIVSDLKQDATSHPKYTFVNIELQRHGKLVIGNDADVKLHVFKWLHDSAVGGHSGRDATLKRIKTLFFYTWMNNEVQQYHLSLQNPRLLVYLELDFFALDPHILSFNTMHLKEANGTFVVGTHHGLVCLYHKYRSIQFWNPSTGWYSSEKRKRFKENWLRMGYDLHHRLVSNSGFWINPANKEFKVILFDLKEPRSDMQAVLYRSDTRLWAKPSVEEQLTLVLKRCIQAMYHSSRSRALVVGDVGYWMCNIAEDGIYGRRGDAWEATYNFRVGSALTKILMVKRNPEEGQVVGIKAVAVYPIL
ncbi:hypothetical protein V2J09_013754 [Rumex salicifolius]